MKNIKWLLATIFIALIVYSNTAKAEDQKTYTINEVKEEVIEQGEKLKNHVVEQIESTKTYQAEQWAKIKAQWAVLITKFSSE